MFTTLFVRKTCGGGYVHMLKHPSFMAFVYGHTDPVGIFDVNKWLSGNGSLALAFS